MTTVGDMFEFRTDDDDGDNSEQRIGKKYEVARREAVDHCRLSSLPVATPSHMLLAGLVFI